MTTVHLKELEVKGVRYRKKDPTETIIEQLGSIQITSETIQEKYNGYTFWNMLLQEYPNIEYKHRIGYVVENHFYDIASLPVFDI